MALTDIRIKISGDPSALDPTIKKMEEVGAVDAKNAAQFKKNNVDYQNQSVQYVAAAAKRKEALEKEIATLGQLREAQKRAFKPEDIKHLATEIRATEGRISALGTEMKKTATAADGMGKTMGNSLGPIKSFYGALKTVANIIPGLGISTLILVGYQALISLFDSLTGSVGENEEAIKANNEAVQEQIKLRNELQGVLDKAVQSELEAQGLISKTDIEKNSARDRFFRVEEEQLKKRAEFLKEQGELFEMSEADMKKYQQAVEKSAQVNLSMPQLRALRDYFATVKEFDKKIRNFDKLQKQTLAKNAEVLDGEIRAIDTKAFEDKKKKDSERNKAAFDKAAAEEKAALDQLWQMRIRNDEDEIKRLERQADYEIKHLKGSKATQAKIAKEIEIKLAKDIADIHFQAQAYYDKLVEKISEERLKKRGDEVKTQAAAWKKELNDLEKSQKEIDDAQEKRQKEIDDKAIDGVKTFATAMEQYLSTIGEARVKAIENEQKLLDKSIDIQRDRAEKGLSNDLAFELKRQNELEKQRRNEQKKLMKIKELEVFLNSVAAFSKEDPKSAVLKAIAQLALVKGAEALYMEDAGILGMNNPKSRVGPNGFSRRHKSGKDVLVHAEIGEGMFSKKEVDMMGGPTAFMAFKAGLHKPFNERAIAMDKIVPNQINMKEVVNEIQSLKQVLINKKETTVDWEGLYMRLTEKDNGVINSTLHKPSVRIR